MYIMGSIAAVTLVKTAFVVNQRDRLPLTYLLIIIAAFGAATLVRATSVSLSFVRSSRTA